jgi:hypothetical protein
MEFRSGTLVELRISEVCDDTRDRANRVEASAGRVVVVDRRRARVWFNTTTGFGSLCVIQRPLTTRNPITLAKLGVVALISTGGWFSPALAGDDPSTVTRPSSDSPCVVMLAAATRGDDSRRRRSVSIYLRWLTNQGVRRTVFTLVALAVTPLVAIFAIRLRSVVKEATRDVRRRQSEIVSIVPEGLASIRVVKAFAQGAFDS